MECCLDTFVPVFGDGGQFLAGILGGGSAVKYQFLRCIKIQNNIAVMYNFILLPLFPMFNHRANYGRVGLIYCKIVVDGRYWYGSFKGL